MSKESAMPRGEITTLLDLADRDSQDDFFTPIKTQETWFTRDQDRRIRPFTPAVQNFPFRGPAAFGQRFTFDLGSVSCGDLLFGLTLQIKLGHWFDPTTILRLQSQRYQYVHPEEAWYYANSIGTVLLEKAELEIDDQVIETIGGDFSNIYSRLLPTLNTQVGFGIDGYGQYPLTRLAGWPQYRPFPTEDGVVYVLLPFFFSRIRQEEAFPLIACREGTVRVNITLRNFADCVRIASGRRATCDETPLGKTFQMYDYGYDFPLEIDVTASSVPPQFNDIQLITYGAYLDGVVREQMLRSPFEILHRGVQTFYFTEPMTYLVNKTSSDTITVQLPLEANHPMEEIVWVLRRKAAITNNNEWTNYGAVTSAELNSTFNPQKPFLVSAMIQINGIELINAEEEWFRQHIAKHHMGGIAPYSAYVYGYSFARKPGEHQPSGTLNASRSQSIRLTLVVTPPGGNQDQEWEVVCFVVGLRWLRFQNGIANRMFED